jgi:hypothetical protein
MEITIEEFRNTIESVGREVRRAAYKEGHDFAMEQYLSTAKILAVKKNASKEIFDFLEMLEEYMRTNF